MITFYIYKITNKLNNKCYIGKTKNLENRFYQHCYGHHKHKSLIHLAIKKYGKDNFLFEPIFESESEQEISEKEKFFIDKFNSLNPNGYNLVDFNTNGNLIFNPNTLVKMSKVQQGISRTKRVSKYIGVVPTYSKESIVSYRCCVRINTKVHSKSFKSEKKAAIFYDKMSLFLYGEQARINFEYNREKYLKEDLKKVYDSFVYKKPKKYLGISKCKTLWRCRVSIEGKELHVGSYSTEEEAAHKRDLAVLYFKCKSKLNFPENSYSLKDIENIKNEIDNNKSKTSSHVGVSKLKNGKWRAYYYINKKYINLGNYETENEAILAVENKK
jgi:group I intron endonuclease